MLAGQELEEPKHTSSGAAFKEDVSFLTPARLEVRFAPEITLVVRCEGYAELQRSFRVEPTWPIATDVTLGTLTVTSGTRP